MALVLLLPVYPVLGGWLFAHNIPSSVIGPMRFWKEVVVLSLAVKVTPAVWKSRDPVDIVALAFLGVVAFFLVMPIGPPIDARLLGAREDAFFVIVFLVAKHAGVDRRSAMQIQTAVIAVGCVLAGFGIWNHFSPNAWATWVYQVGLLSYIYVVLGAATAAVINYSTLGGSTFVRAGSLLLDPLALAYYMLIPIGVIIGRGIAQKIRRLDVATGAICLGRPTGGADAELDRGPPLDGWVGDVDQSQALRLAAVLIAATVVILPLAGTLGLGDQLAASTSTTEFRNAGHLEGSPERDRPDRVQPAGHRAGNGGGGGPAIRSGGDADNRELVLPARGRDGPAGHADVHSDAAGGLTCPLAASSEGVPVATAALLGLSGIAAGGLLLHTLEDISVAWTIWLLAGLGLSLSL